MQDAAQMVAESQRSCQEVWSPGYDHSPELSDSEEPQGRPQEVTLALRYCCDLFQAQSAAGKQLQVWCMLL